MEIVIQNKIKLQFLNSAIFFEVLKFMHTVYDYMNDPNISIYWDVNGCIGYKIIKQGHRKIEKEYYPTGKLCRLLYV